MQITKITDGFAVSPQLAYDHMQKLADAGYKTIINNRPDGEDTAQPLSKALEKSAKKAGLSYHHIPFKPGRFTPDDQQKFKAVLRQAAQDTGPILAFCRTGMRARAIHKSVTKTPGFFARLFGR